MARPRDGARTLYRCGSFTLGEFHLEPQAQRWHELNNIGAGHHLVFPGTPVGIEHAGRGSLVADPNTAVLYRPFEDYRRRVIGDGGDHCVYVIPAPSLLEEIAGVDDPFTRGETQRPAPARAYLAIRTVAAIAAGPEDRLAIEEVTLGVLWRVLGGDGSSLRRGVVEDTKELLATCYAENVALAEIARAVHLSPYHLARLFRRATGWSIHGYRTQLRLRASLELLADEDRTIAEVAAATGFASHAHLTDSFRRAFGIVPSDVRVGSPERRLSTMLEA